MTIQIRPEIQQIIVHPNMPITDCIGVLDRTGKGVLAICDANYILQGILTDGDIRRALLEKLSLSEPCITIAGTHPLTALEGTLTLDALHLMNNGKPFLVHHLPILDKGGHLKDLLLRSDFQQTEKLTVRAVVMAGGFGKRLRPLTENIPKPMLPLGDRPVMEHIINQLKDAGISNINVTTHYLSEKICSYFGNGSDFGVSINYVKEQNPLGTAGSLALVESSNEPILVINGDILTNVDFRSMIAFHRENNADLTVCIRQYDLQVPYGVLDCESMLVTAIREKPTIQLFVNAGIYLLEPHVHDCVPDDENYDMTDLMEQLIADGKRVVSFPIIEYWMDIGKISDYEKAQSDVKDGLID